MSSCVYIRPLHPFSEPQLLQFSEAPTSVSSRTVIRSRPPPMTRKTTLTPSKSSMAGPSTRERASHLWQTIVPYRPVYSWWWVLIPDCIASDLKSRAAPKHCFAVTEEVETDRWGTDCPGRELQGHSLKQNGSGVIPSCPPNQLKLRFP